MGTITKSNTFASAATIIASEHNTNFDEIISEFNGNIENVNVKSGAAIAAAKLNLSTIAQAIEFDGNCTFAGTTIADLGTVTTAAFTAITDLGTVTTADINGGTLDGVQIGGTTATGELIVNNATDDADGLGSQGTSGQVLTSAGTGANPTWSSKAMVLIDHQEETTVTSSTNITIQANKNYILYYEGRSHASTDSEIWLRFNDDSAGYVNTVDAGTDGALLSGGAAHDAGALFGGVVHFSTEETVNAKQVMGNVAGFYYTTGAAMTSAANAFSYSDVAALTSVEIAATGAFQHIVITLYELSLA